jgi:hypothetical protein
VLVYQVSILPLTADYQMVIDIAPFHCQTADCQVVIRPTLLPGTEDLNLGEVQLFARDGSQIPPSQLRMSLSSTYNGDYDVNRCNDGDTTGLFPSICATAGPGTLTVAYSCPTGDSGSLSRVVVSNRGDCCQTRINTYSLDFLNAQGVIDQTFDFSGSSSRYIISVLSEWCMDGKRLGAIVCYVLGQIDISLHWAYSHC